MSRKRARHKARRQGGPTDGAVIGLTGHEPPAPAQFGARHRPQPAMQAKVPGRAMRPMPPIPSTAEAEGMASPGRDKADCTAMSKDHPPLPPDAPAPSVAQPLGAQGQPGRDTAVPLPRPSSPPSARSAALPVPAFPPPQLAPIPGGPSTNPAPAQTARKPILAKPERGPDPKHSADWRRAMPPRPASMPAQTLTPPLNPPRPATGEARALPLPPRPEPLAQRDTAPLPRNRALAQPDAGLLGALNGWLRATGQRLLRSFMVKKPRKTATPPSSLRERVELTQLRAENRRLREQLESMNERRGQATPPPRAEVKPMAEAISPPSGERPAP
jgi:hypothetical protein